PRLDTGVLACDRAIGLSSHVAKGLQRGERSDVVDGTDQNTSSLSAAKVLANRIECSFELAASIEARDAHGAIAGKALVDSVQHPGQARVESRARNIRPEQQHLLYIGTPNTRRPLAQAASGHSASLVVVGSEVNRARMRNIDRDKRNVRVGKFSGHLGGHFEIDLRIDHEVDLLVDKALCVDQGGLRAKVIVENE